jgi:hypothetical protein
MKYLKTFEMFDSENLRDEHIHDTNSGNLDKNDLVKSISRFDSKYINDRILREVPFFRKSNYRVLLDKIEYVFGDSKNNFKLVIYTKPIKVDGSEINHYRYETFETKNGIEKSSMDVYEDLTLSDIIDFCDGVDEYIAKEDYNISDKNMNTIYGSMN